MWGALAIVSISPIAARADQSELLEGTWTIDVLATVAKVKKLDPPARNAEWLPSILLRQCVTTLTFDQGSMIVDPISPAPIAQTFRLKRQSDKELTFTLVGTGDEKKDTVSVTFLKSDNITVKSAKIGLDEYAVWKRGKRPNRDTAEQDFKHVFDSCASALEHIPFFKASGR